MIYQVLFLSKSVGRKRPCSFRIACSFLFLLRPNSCFTRLTVTKTSERWLHIDVVFPSWTSDTFLLDGEAGTEQDDQSEADHWRGPAPTVEEKSRWGWQLMFKLKWFLSQMYPSPAPHYLVIVLCINVGRQHHFQSLRVLTLPELFRVFSHVKHPIV